MPLAFWSGSIRSALGFSFLEQIKSSRLRRATLLQSRRGSWIQKLHFPWTFLVVCLICIEKLQLVFIKQSGTETDCENLCHVIGKPVTPTSLQRAWKRVNFDIRPLQAFIVDSVHVPNLWCMDARPAPTRWSYGLEDQKKLEQHTKLPLTSAADEMRANNTYQVKWSWELNFGDMN